MREVCIAKHLQGGSGLEVSEATRQCWPCSRTRPLNQSRPVSCSCYRSRPIRSQYPCHVITLDQSEASTPITWSLKTNQRPVSRSNDHSRPIRGQYPVTWSRSRPRRCEAARGVMQVGGCQRIINQMWWAGSGCVETRQNPNQKHTRPLKLKFIGLRLDI